MAFPGGLHAQLEGVVRALLTQRSPSPQQLLATLQATDGLVAGIGALCSGPQPDPDALASFLRGAAGAADALGHFPAAVPQHPTELLPYCWRAAAGCRVAEALLRCLAYPDVAPRLSNSTAYMVACSAALIFGPATTLLSVLGHRMVAHGPKPVLRFAAVVLPAAVAAMQLLLGEPAALRQALAHTLLARQVLESFVGQAVEVLKNVEAAQPGAASHCNTVCEALFSCLDALLRCSGHVEPRHLYQLWELAAARRHFLVLRLGPTRASNPESGLLVLRQELRSVGTVMETVDTALAQAKSPTISHYGMEMFQTLLQDALVLLHSGLDSPPSRREQPAVGAPPGHTLYYAGYISYHAAALIAVAHTQALAPRQQMLCLEALALAASAVMATVESLGVSGPGPYYDAQSPFGFWESRALRWHANLVHVALPSLPSWAATPAQPTWWEDRVQLALQAVEAHTRLAGQLLQQGGHIAGVLPAVWMYGALDMVRASMANCLAIASQVMNMLVCAECTSCSSSPPLAQAAAACACSAAKLAQALTQLSPQQQHAANSFLFDGNARFILSSILVNACKALHFARFAWHSARAGDGTCEPRSQSALVSQLLQALRALALAPLPRDPAQDLNFARNTVVCLQLLLHGASTARIAALEAHCSLSWLASAFTHGLAGAALMRQGGARAAVQAAELCKSLDKLLKSQPRLAAHLAVGGLVGCASDTVASFSSNANAAGHPQATLEGLPLAAWVSKLVVTFGSALKQEAARLWVALPLHAHGWQLLYRMEAAPFMHNFFYYDGTMRMAIEPSMRAAAAAILRAQRKADLAEQAEVELAASCAHQVPLACANPACINLRGASELRLRGRQCGGGCGTRYCCQACAAADWPQHCRLCARLAGGRG